MKILETLTAAAGLLLTFGGGMMTGLHFSAAAVITTLAGLVITMFTCDMGGFKWLPGKDDNDE